MVSNPIHADVFNTCPKMLRSLRQRFHHQIPSIARGRLCHAMRRQIPEKLGATRTAFPRTECGNDAVRRSAWKMNEAGRYHRWKRGGVYDKKDTSTLHNGCLPASIIKAISLNWSTGFSKHLCIKNWNYVQRPKRTSHFGTWHLIRLWLPREEHCSPRAGSTPGGYICLIPNSCIPIFSQAQAGHSIIAGGGEQKTILQVPVSGSFSATRHLQDDDT